MLAFVCLILGILAGWVAGSTVMMLNIAEHPQETVAIAQALLEDYK